jgi:hypothetical protein
MADLANSTPRPGYAQDGRPEAARVYENGSEPAKVNAGLDTTAGAAKDV